MLAKTGIFSRDNLYEDTLRSLLKDPSVVKSLKDLQQIELTSIEQIGGNIYLKDETSTPSGTFKYRGAKLLLHYLKSKVTTGLIASSTGNHGISLATICKEDRTPLTVCVPIGTSPEKIYKIESLGSKVMLLGSNLTETITLAKELALSRDEHFISSTDELLAIGHSSLITEAFKQNSKIEKLFFPIGVGSGIAGQILAKLIFDLPIEIIGVVHEAHPAWAESLNAGLSKNSPCRSSLAPGLKISQPNESVFRFVQKHISGLVTISDEDLVRATKLLNTSKNDDLTSCASAAAFLKSGSKDKKQTLIIKC